MALVMRWPSPYDVHLGIRMERLVRDVHYGKQVARYHARGGKDYRFFGPSFPALYRMSQMLKDWYGEV